MTGPWLTVPHLGSYPMEMTLIRKPGSDYVLSLPVSLVSYSDSTI